MRKKIVAAVMAGLMLLSLAACGEKKEETKAADTTAAETTAAETKETEAKETEAKTADLSGSIALSGSTSMEKMVRALSEAFM